jgi:putative endonuclease
MDPSIPDPSIPDPSIPDPSIPDPSIPDPSVPDPGTPDPPCRRPPSPRRALGTLGEDIAIAHLRRLGFALIARNARTRHGEIDAIAFDGKALVFVEVKCRRATPCRRGVCPANQPLAWLRFSQRHRLRGLARAWLAANSHTRPTAQTIRFDAIGVIVDGTGRLVRLDHIENAW